MCAPIKNVNDTKKTFNYSIVRGIGIPGDPSPKTVMSFGDMITSNHFSQNIAVFYGEIKNKFIEEFKYWPPFEGKYSLILYI